MDRGASESPIEISHGLEEVGTPPPAPRPLTELKADPEIANDIQTHAVAQIESPARDAE